MASQSRSKTLCKPYPKIKFPTIINIENLLPFQFVSHPNVQQLLASIWYEGLPGFRRKNMALQSLEIIRIGKEI
jgi:hypothetical protein